jgi:transcriptional regulator GlxA family with amidase domain
MDIAILTFEGFNELDSFIASSILNKMKPQGWNVRITCPSKNVTSMNGVSIQAQEQLEFANTADVVLFGSGIYTRDIAENSTILDRLKLDSSKQLIGAQCSGTLLMSKLGLIDDLPACTDLISKPWIIEAGVDVLEQAFVAKNNIATSGGCMASEYLATWVLLKKSDKETAMNILSYVAPVGESKEHIKRCISSVEPFV